jgi:hypothetical protein
MSERIGNRLGGDWGAEADYAGISFGPDGGAHSRERPDSEEGVPVAAPAPAQPQPSVARSLADLTRQVHRADMASWAPPPRQDPEQVPKAPEAQSAVPAEAKMPAVPSPQPEGLPGGPAAALKEASAQLAPARSRRSIGTTLFDTLDERTNGFVKRHIQRQGRKYAVAGVVALALSSAVAAGDGIPGSQGASVTAYGATHRVLSAPWLLLDMEQAKRWKPEYRAGVEAFTDELLEDLRGVQDRSVQLAVTRATLDRALARRDEMAALRAINHIRINIPGGMDDSRMAPSLAAAFMFLAGQKPENEESLRRLEAHSSAVAAKGRFKVKDAPWDKAVAEQIDRHLAARAQVRPSSPSREYNDGWEAAAAYTVATFSGLAPSAGLKQQGVDKPRRRLF